jgi:eukaryotic-like serine/threonine-protein kinase
MAEERDPQEGFISPDDMEESVQSRPPPRRPGSAARQDPRVGTTLDGRFRINRMIARGGMGKIYEAEQIQLGRRIALKVMDLGYAEELDPDFQKRFFLEASTCAALSHPNTIRIFDYGHSDDETYYIAMEFIVGMTLLEAIDQAAPLEPLRVIHIARQICASLAEAHGQGVIHRDLKPSNVLLTRHGEHQDFVKVLDFGLVKLVREDAEEMTKSGLFLGSPNYMSPEQIRSNTIDQRADLYSLGVILYMCITGKSPFKRNSSVNVLLAQLEDDPPPFEVPGVPASLEWVVMTCLEKDPNARFASVQELNKALKACDAELRGQVEPLTMEIDRGRVVLPGEVSTIISTVRFPSSTGSGSVSGGLGASRRVAGPDPVSSAGSIVSRRLRPDDSADHADETGSRPGRTAARKRKRKRSTLDQLLTSPLFAMFLGALVLFLVVALIFLVVRLMGDSGIVVEDEPMTQPAPTPLMDDLPTVGGVLPAGEVTPAATSQPTPRVTRPEPTPRVTRPEPTPRVTRPEPTPRITRPEPTPGVVQPEPTAEPTPTPEPVTAEPTPAPTPTPTPRTPGSDLRDPWGS